MTAPRPSYPLLVIVDYDRTLFDTSRFETALLGVLEDNYELDAGQFKAEIQAESAGPVGYDLFDHLAKYNISEANFSAAIESKQTTQSFLFPDSLAFLEHLSAFPEVTVHIVTVGAPSYQRLKLMELKYHQPNLVMHIIGINKGTWLADQWAHTELQTQNEYRLSFHGQNYRHAIVIDDRIDSFADLHHHPLVTGLHVLREGAKYQERHPNLATVPNLAAAAAFIDEFRLR